MDTSGVISKKITIKMAGIFFIVFVCYQIITLSFNKKLTMAVEWSTHTSFAIAMISLNHIPAHHSTFLNNCSVAYILYISIFILLLDAAGR